MNGCRWPATLAWKLHIQKAAVIWPRPPPVHLTERRRETEHFYLQGHACLIAAIANCRKSSCRRDRLLSR
jgi:hypothetical protein